MTLAICGVCKSCGEPTLKGLRAWYCERCRKAKIAETQRNWYTSDRGRAMRRAVQAKPKTKLRRGAWAERNRARLSAYNHTFWLEHRKSKPVIVTCLTLFCGNKFWREAHQARRSFCDVCVIANYGRHKLKSRHPEVAA